MASNEIFDAFSSPEKSDALLHGHSYTAHAIGCTVAVDSLQTMADLDTAGSWNEYRSDWKTKHVGSADKKGAETSPEVWSVWSHSLVYDLSHAKSVDGLFALGTVLSISLKDAQGAGRFILSRASGNGQGCGGLGLIWALQATRPRQQRDFKNIFPSARSNSTCTLGFWGMCFI